MLLNKMGELFIFFLFAIGINLFMFIFAYLFKTDKLTDASYGLTFIFLSAYALLTKNLNLSKIILFILISVWALRLIVYLFVRIIHFGRDKRFDGRRENFFRFLNFWFLQGISVFIILLPVLLFSNKNNLSLGVIEILGLFIFIIGLLIEGVSDIQKFRFIINSKI